MKSDAYYSGISGETVKKIRFRKHIGKSGKIWLVGIANDELHAEILNEIYVSADPREDELECKNRGFGGSTLKFQLENGSTTSLKGPWHSNPTVFTEDTGIELLP